MPADTVYTLVNAFVVPFWLLLLIAPHSKPTNLLVHSGLVPVLLGLVYAFYIIIGITGGATEGASMQTLDGLLIAFSDKQALIGAWVHYLVFDLFVGAWLIRDAKRHGIPHFAVVIPAILTFMLGPVGLLLYVTLKFFWKQQFSFLEDAAGDAAS